MPDDRCRKRMFLWKLREHRNRERLRGVPRAKAKKGDGSSRIGEKVSLEARRLSKKLERTRRK